MKNSLSDLFSFFIIFFLNEGNHANLKIRMERTIVNKTTKMQKPELSPPDEQDLDEYSDSFDLEEEGIGEDDDSTAELELHSFNN